MRAHLPSAGPRSAAKQASTSRSTSRTATNLKAGLTRDARRAPLLATSETASRDDPRGRRALPCWPRIGGSWGPRMQMLVGERKRVHAARLDQADKRSVLRQFPSS